MSGWGNLLDKFKPAAGSWKCKMCLVMNKPDAVECVSCGAKRAPDGAGGGGGGFSGAPAPAPAPSGGIGAGGFTFGAAPAPAPAPSGGIGAGGFTFGAAPAPAPAAAKKKKRLDGQMSKEEYAVKSREASTPGQFSRASSQAIASRRIVKGSRDKGAEYTRHLVALNNSFSAWVDEQMRKNPVAPWTAAIQDYLQYVRQLDGKYGSRRGNIYTFGSSDAGQLGHGIDDDKDLMVKVPRIVAALKGKHITQISCGGLHTVAITDAGSVYSWGCNDDGSLGRGGDENQPSVIEGVPKEEVFVQVVAGACHSVALTVNGEVYTWGSYRDGDGKAFFHGEANRRAILQAESEDRGWKVIEKDQSNALVMSELSHVCVQDICGGYSFSAALCTDGQVFTWGINDCSVESKDGAQCSWLGRPVCPIKALRADRTKKYDVEGIFREHLTPRPPTFSFGAMGTGMSGGMSPMPLVKCIGAGSYHLMVAAVLPGEGSSGGGGGGSSSGGGGGGKVGSDCLFATGLNNYGQLGIGTIVHADTLTRVSALDGVPLSALKGGEHHSMALASDGSIYSWGRGDSGQLGIVDKLQGGGMGKRKEMPSGYCEMSPKRVTLGATENAATIATDDRSAPAIKATEISCGDNHCLAVTSSNDVYSWGYGDMLALGNGRERDEYVPHKINLAKTGFAGAKVLQLGGGGQHSAILFEQQ